MDAGRNSFSATSSPRDPCSRQPDGKATGELNNGALAGGIAGPRRRAHQPQCASERHDAAIPGRAHGLRSLPARQPRSHDVDFQAGSQRIDIELIKSSACLHPSTCHQHIEPAVVSEHSFDESLHSNLVSDVAPQTVHAPPSLRRQTLSGFLASQSRPAGRTTSEPDAASALAIARPSPAEPPVTSATWPAREEHAPGTPRSVWYSLSLDICA